jgi:hypothetical protein
MSKRMVIDMEDSRCRIAAMRTEDLRCKGLITGADIETDPRYRGLGYGRETEMDDPRCKSVVIAMEDPRCKGLNRAW